MTSCVGDYCGTGSGNFPQPGDPDMNNSILQVVPAFGGIDVSWTYPELLPEAVAHTIVYRSTSGTEATAVRYRIVQGDYFFDRSDKAIEYFYWIQFVSVNGTVGPMIGPESAVARPTIDQMIEMLSGQIHNGLLAESLRTQIGRIDFIDQLIQAESATRLQSVDTLGVALNLMQNDMDTALAAIQTVKTAQVSADNALASQISTAQAALGDDLASVQITMQTNIDKVNDVVTDIGALYTAKVDVNGLVGGFGVYNDGTTVEAGFDADLFWVGKGDTKRKPFIVDTQSGETYIDQAVIDRLTFDKLRSADGSVMFHPATYDEAGNLLDDAKLKVTYLDVDNLVARQAASPNYSPGSTGWKLGLDGSAELNNISLRGSAESYGYSTTTPGWQLNSDGSFTLRGTGGQVILATNNNLDYTYVDGGPPADATSNKTYFQATAPATGKEGDFWVDSDDEKFYTHNGTSWVAAGKVASDKYTWIKYADTSSGTGISDSPTGKSYIGIAHNKTTATESNTPEDYTWSLIKGADGTNGTNGADGVDGKDGVSIVWQGSFASHPSNPQNGWAYKNTSDGKSYVRQSGTWYQMTVDGVDGANGADGLSIVWKGDSASPPANPATNWVYRDTDNGLVYLYNGTAWELMVADGSDGANGTNGSDGQSVYITYHDSESQPANPIGNGTTNGWHTNTTTKVIWMSQKIAASADSGTWGTPIKVKGETGPQGPQGIQGSAGVNGSNGSSLYTWVKYADNASGGGMSDYPTNKKYIGLAYNKTTATESTNAGDYTWALLKGDQGVQGPSGSDGQTYYTWIKYATTPTTGMSDNPSGKAYMGVAYNKTSQTESTKYSDYSWSLIKGADGAKGATGAKGDPGDSTFTYYQSYTPSGAKVNELWYNTSDLLLRRFNGSSWNIITSKINSGTYIKNAIVDTLHLAGQAVTVPTGITYTNTVEFDNEDTFLSVVVNPKGGKVYISGSITVTGTYTQNAPESIIRLKRDGTTLVTLRIVGTFNIVPINFVDDASLGNADYTYSVTLAQVGIGRRFLETRTLTAIGLKR